MAKWHQWAAHAVATGEIDARTGDSICRHVKEFRPVLINIDTDKRVRELERQLKAAKKELEKRGRDFGRYDRDPVGFIRDVVGGKPWPRQVEIAKAVTDRSQVTVRSCHSAGKDWLAGRLAGCEKPQALLV